MGRTVPLVSTTDDAARTGHSPSRAVYTRGRGPAVVPAGASLDSRAVPATTDLPALREDGGNDRRIEL